MSVAVSSGNDLSRRQETGFLLNKADIAVYLFVLFIGSLLFWFYPRIPDVVSAPPYLELARSLILKGSYSYNGHVETLLPPGLPLLLVLVAGIFGLGEPVLFRLVGFCATLGLFACYELLRRTEGRKVAVGVTLLLGSAPAFFNLTMAGVFPDLPYFLVSIGSLLLAWEAGRARGLVQKAAWLAAFSVALVFAILLRSVGMALLTGLCIWMLASYIRNATLGRARFAMFLVPLLLGAGVQWSWSHWAAERQSTQWPLPGYPESYWSQLKVKNGNEPELGYAHLGDLPRRIEENVRSRSEEFSALMVHHWIGTTWSSPAVFGSGALIVIGWVSSIWETGGELFDWYFAGYEGIYALWPWEFELRFLVPVAPLAILYLWRGGRAVWRFTGRRPRLAGIGLLVMGLLLTIEAAYWMYRVPGFQAALSTCWWCVITAVGAYLVVSSMDGTTSSMPKLDFWPEWIRIALSASVWLVTASIVVTGCLGEMRLAYQNLGMNDLSKAAVYPDIEAAQWIRANEPSEAVVMARRDDLVFHYSGHHVIWFPPIDNPDTLMDGIRHYDVGFVVVIDRNSSYWRPAEKVCFENLEKSYGAHFSLVHRGPRNWVFQVHGPWTTADRPQCPSRLEPSNAGRAPGDLRQKPVLRQYFGCFRNAGKWKIGALGDVEERVVPIR